jgi:sugar/nucleoside kinase (ribokinase family)
LEELHADQFWRGLLLMGRDMEGTETATAAAAEIVRVASLALEEGGWKWEEEEEARGGLEGVEWWRRMGREICEQIRRRLTPSTLRAAQGVLREFAWLHFEGRAIRDTLVMLVSVLALRSDTPFDPPPPPPPAALFADSARHPPIPLRRPTVSLEAEKSRQGLARLLPFCDLAVCSRDFCASLGIAVASTDARPDAAGAALVRLVAPGVPVVIPWGARGAGAYWTEEDGGGGGGSGGGVCEMFTEAYAPPEGVVDTVGAGDTFQAGLITALAAAWPLPSAMRAAVRLAGTKVGQVGFGDVARRAGMDALFRAE